VSPKKATPPGCTESRAVSAVSIHDDIKGLSKENDPPAPCNSSLNSA
jgi:hypothetical protein